MSIQRKLFSLIELSADVQQVADAIGVDAQTLCRWVGGMCVPPPTRARSLSTVIGMPLRECLNELTIWRERERLRRQQSTKTLEDRLAEARCHVPQDTPVV